MNRHMALVPATTIDAAWLRDAVAQSGAGVLVHVADSPDGLPRMAGVIAAVADRGVFEQIVLDVSGAAATRDTLAQLSVDVPVITRAGPAVAEDVHDTLLQSECGVLVTHADSHAALCCALAAVRLDQAVVRVGGAPQNGPGRAIARLADVLLTRTPRDADVATIASERVTVIGDPLVDVVQRHARVALSAAAWRRYGLDPGSYVLAILRAAPTLELTAKLTGVAATGALLLEAPEGYVIPGAQRVCDLTFLERLSLERAARAIFTDSDQVREEAAQFGVPCHDRDGQEQPPRATPTVAHESASWDRGASARAADALVAHFALVRLAP